MNRQQDFDENEKLNHQEIPIKDTLYLSPIDKYKLYGKFPWKMIIHFLLLIGTTAQAVLIINATTQYTRAQERVFFDSFVIPIDKTTLDYKRFTYLFSIEELRNSVKTSINNFYALKDNLFEELEYDKNEVKMEVSYLNASNPKDKRQFDYILNQNDLGPFADDKIDLLKNFIKNIYSFDLKYKFKTYVPEKDLLNMECFLWDLTQTYSFSERAHFILKLNSVKKNCKDKSISNVDVTYFQIFLNKLLWIHFLVFILALSSFILTWKYVYKIAKIYWKIKYQLQNEPATNYNKTIEMINLAENNNDPNFNQMTKWDQLNMKEKGKFFNKWSLICLVGNLIQIFGCALSLLEYQEINTSSEMLIGFGALFAYINIGRYLDYNKDYSTIYSTISRALPNVLRYLLGVLPIFFGFIFFGLCLFWRSERFSSTSSTMMILFAVLNGDSVFDMFNDLAGVSFFLGQLYSYCFCILFIV